MLEGRDAAVCLIGGRGTGKSRCLFGTHNKQATTGLLPLFAEAYYQRSNQDTVMLIELAIIQVYKEEVCLRSRNEITKCILGT